MGHPRLQRRTVDDGPRRSTAVSDRAVSSRGSDRTSRPSRSRPRPRRSPTARSRQTRRRAIVTNAKSIDCGSCGCGGRINPLIVDGSRGNLESHAAGVEVAAVGALVVRLHRQHPHAPAAGRADGAIDVGIDRAGGRRRTPRRVRSRCIAARRTWRIVVHRVPSTLWRAPEGRQAHPCRRSIIASIIATAPSAVTRGRR